jgi:hypothetical protein
VSETSSRENNARVEAVTRLSTEKSGCDWNATWPYNALVAEVPPRRNYQGSTSRWIILDQREPGNDSWYTNPDRALWIDLA